MKEVISRHPFRLFPALILSPILAALMPAFAVAQPGDDFIPLIRDEPQQDWDLVNAGEDSFVWEDGRLIVRGERGWLKSPRQHSDFILRLEVRFMNEDADSGLFVRTGEATTFTRGWPGTSFQVQLRHMDGAGDTRPLGAVYRLEEPEGEVRHDAAQVRELYKGIGEWHHMEITMLGRQLTVKLEGEEIAVAENIPTPRGYIGIQSEAGETQFRNMVIHDM